MAKAKQKNVRLTPEMIEQLEAAVTKAKIPGPYPVREAMVASISMFLSLSSEGQRAWIAKWKARDLGFGSGVELDRIVADAQLQLDQQDAPAKIGQKQARR